MNNISNINRKIISWFLMFYASSLVLLDNPPHIMKLHVMTISLWALFFFFNYKQIINNLKINFIIIIYTLFILWCFLSLFWAIDFGYSFNKAFTLLLVLINLIVIYNILIIYRNINYFFIGIALAIVVNFFISLGLIDIGWEYMEGGWRFQGSSVKSNILANTVLFGSVIALYFIIEYKENTWFKVLGIILLILSAYIGLLTGSKKFIILFLLLLAFTSFISINRKTFFKILFSLVILYIFLIPLGTLNFFLHDQNFDLSYLMQQIISRFELFIATISGENVVDKSTDIRVELVEHALLLLSYSPFIGQGIGGFAYSYGTYAHNNYMDILANLGIIGFFIYYSMYIYIFYTYKKNINKTLASNIFMFYLFLLMVSELAIVSYASKYIMLFILIVSIQITKEKNDFTST